MRHLPFFVGVRQGQITGDPSGAARAAHFKFYWLDELGRLYLQTVRGFGLVHTQDMVLAGEAVEQGRWSRAGAAAGTLGARGAQALLLCAWPGGRAAGPDRATAIKKAGQ